jgi:hypothetical protein
LSGTATNPTDGIGQAVAHPNKNNGGKKMISILKASFCGALCCALLLATAGSAVAKHEVIVGPERTVYEEFQVDDYNDCTNEIVNWKATFITWDYEHISGNGNNLKYHVVRHFQWTATVTGLDTGYVWETRGGGKDSIKYDPTDGLPYKEVFVENSVLKPVSPGAPRIQFHALIRVRIDDMGDTIVESVDYEYSCIGK